MLPSQNLMFGLKKIDPWFNGPLIIAHLSLEINITGPGYKVGNGHFSLLL